MTKDKVLNLALEIALEKEYLLRKTGQSHVIEPVITAIREALAQPEHEPVALVAEVHMSRYTIEWTNGPLPEGTKLYTTPPHRKPLSDEEFQKICTRLSRQGGWDVDGWDLALKEAIEAAHGIKE